MIIFDVNLLVAAYRSDHPHHERVHPWLGKVVASSRPIAVPDLVWVGFVRICTNPRIFSVPSGLGQTLDFVGAFVAQPTYVHLGGLPHGIGAFTDVAREADASANLVADAYIAAVALHWAASVATLDRDFRRFDGLSIIEPD